MPIKTILKIVVERHADGYGAYPLSLERGAIVGKGESANEAIEDLRSAITFHVETFGKDSLAIADDTPVLASVA